jgi:phage terminase large subunit
MPFTPKDVSVMKQWAHDCERFVREALCTEKVSAQQRQLYGDMTRLVWAKINRAEGKKISQADQALARKIGISIMSGKGTGKTIAAAQVMIWFLVCFPEALVVCTAPTAHQLRDNLWRSLSRVRDGVDVATGSKPPIIRDLLTIQTDKVFVTEAKGEKWYIVGRTANPRGSEAELAETLSGFHAPYMLIVGDESAAVPEAVFRDLEGTLTEKCNLALLLFNPTRGNGYAYETQTKFNDKWVAHRWSSEDSEWVTKDSIESKRVKYGEDSNFFRVTVLGLPPLLSSDTLIPYEWAMDAVDRDVEALNDDIEIAGIDVGAGGDPSIYLHRKGPVVKLIKQMDSPEPEVLTGKLIGHIYDNEPRYVFVDKIGVGHHLVGHLKDRMRGADVSIIGVNVSELPASEIRFYRKRDELCWRVRERFSEREISIPNDPILIAELTTIKFTEPNGKIKIESKKELKTRGLESPNRFDALALTEYYRTDYLRKMSGDKVIPLWKRQKASAASWKTV